MKKSKNGYWIREYFGRSYNTNYVFSYFNKEFKVLFEPINPTVSLKHTYWRDDQHFPRNSHDIKDRKLTPLEIVTYKLLGYLDET